MAIALFRTKASITIMSHVAAGKTILSIREVIIVNKTNGCLTAFQQVNIFIGIRRSNCPSGVRPTLLYIWRPSPQCAPLERSRRKSLDFGCDSPSELLHQKSKRKSIDASYKNLDEIISILT